MNSAQDVKLTLETLSKYLSTIASHRYIPSLITIQNKKPRASDALKHFPAFSTFLDMLQRLSKEVLGLGSKCVQWGSPRGGERNF